MNEWTLLFLMEGAGVIGMLAHFWKKLLREQTFDSLKQYIVGNPGFTIRAFAATIGAVAGLWEATDPANLTSITVIITVVSGAFTTGWTFDSMLNKSTSNGTG